MSGAGLNADQDRCLTRMAMLQLGSELETVSGDDSVIGVRGGDERGWIAGARFQVVVGLIGQQGLECVRVVGSAVVIDPVAAGGEFVEP